MRAYRHPYRVAPEHEHALARRLDEAAVDGEPVILEIAGSRYRLVPDDETDRGRYPRGSGGPTVAVAAVPIPTPVSDDEIQTTDNPAANYDPGRVLAAIEAGAGALAGIDVAASLAEIAEAREQDTPGRPV